MRRRCALIVLLVAAVAPGLVPAAIGVCRLGGEMVVLTLHRHACQLACACGAREGAAEGRACDAQHRHQHEHQHLHQDAHEHQYGGGHTHGHPPRADAGEGACCDHQRDATDVAHVPHDHSEHPPSSDRTTDQRLVVDARPADAGASLATPLPLTPHAAPLVERLERRALGACSETRAAQAHGPPPRVGVVVLRT